MLTHTLPAVWRAERAAEEGGLVPALRQLRRMGLAEFADVMLAMPDPRFAALSAVLPRMPAPEVQFRFDGAAGKPVMQDAVSVVRLVAGAFRELARRPLRGTRILDYGCGWGRLLRLLTYFADPETLTGLDWRPEAVVLCAQDGVPGRIALCDELPGALAAHGQFDLIAAYSVLTGRPLAAMDALMAAFRAVLAEDGMLAVTVRPVEFWTFLAQCGDAAAVSLQAQHKQDGFAFRPHAESGDAWGDCSVDLAWFADRYPDWELRTTDRGWDELQTVLLLTPR